MNEQFKVGDVVRLKSGSPAMTISSINDTGVTCQWFDNNNCKEHFFKHGVFEHIPENLGENIIL